MRANTDRAPGVRLVTDRTIVPPVSPGLPSEPDFPVIEDDHDARDLVALSGRLNAGIAVQLLLDRTTLQTFVTTVVDGDCLTVEVEGTEAWDAYSHPGAYGLLPQLS